MLPNPSPGGGDHGGQGGQGGPGGGQGGNQDWNSEESLVKLKGLFIPALQKVNRKCVAFKQFCSI